MVLQLVEEVLAALLCVCEREGVGRKCSRARRPLSDRQTSRQADKQTSRQADKQTDRQTDTEVLRCPFLCRVCPHKALVCAIYVFIIIDRRWPCKCPSQIQKRAFCM